MHEDFHREDRVDGSSNRSFGLVLSIAFLLVALAPLLSGRSIRVWSLGVALAFGIAALAAPTALGPLNRVWMKFGLLLHRIVSPVILGIMFFLVVTPMGMVMRVLRKDPLRLRQDHEARTYWVERTPPGPRSDSFTDQF